MPRHKHKMVARLGDILGQTIGWWTVVEYVGQDARFQHVYLVECRCGTVAVHTRAYLTFYQKKAGDAISCGCKRWVNRKKPEAGHSMTCSRCPRVFKIGERGSRGIICRDCWRHLNREYMAERKRKGIPRKRGLPTANTVLS